MKLFVVMLLLTSLVQASIYPNGGQALANLFFALYAYFVLRPFWQQVPLVFVENVVCFAVLSLVNGTLSTLRLIADLEADTLKDGKARDVKSSDGSKGTPVVGKDTDMRGIFPLHDLPKEKMIACIVASSASIMCYGILATLAILTARDLRRSIENDIFGVQGGGRGGGGGFGAIAPGETLPFSRSASSNFGTYSAPPVGVYAPNQDTQRESPPRSDNSRFPGRGFKLNA